MKRHVVTALVAFNVALTVALTALWLNPDGSLRNTRWAAPTPIKNDYLQMLPSLPERQPIDTNRFLVLLERPLFQLTRRPPPPPPPPTPVTQEVVDNLSTAQLSGVVTGAGDGSASIIITMGGKARRVRLNESVDGWTLQSIQGRSVTFAGGGQTRVLQLPRAAMTNFAGTTMPTPPAPSPAIEPPPPSATQAAPAAPPANAAADATAKSPRRSRFSSGPQ